MGIVYHIIFFSAINKAAYIFGGFFIIQGIMFAGCGLIRKKLSFEYTKSRQIMWNSTYCLCVDYLSGAGTFLGHTYPYSPTFGLPCPTTIFTFGILLFTNKKMPPHLLIIPLLWSIIGFTAALSLTIYGYWFTCCRFNCCYYYFLNLILRLICLLVFGFGVS
jgi:hypothetical protein